MRITPTARSRVVELILSRPPSLEKIWLTQFLRRDCGIRKCGFHETKPEGESPMTPTELAGAIRKAADRMTGCLIVEPIDDTEVRKALNDASSRGLPLILLDTPLPSFPPLKPYPCVAFSGFEKTGQEIVAILKEDAAKLKLTGAGKALVLDSEEKDANSRKRLDSLTNALKAAGVTYDVLAFDGDAKAAENALSKYLESHSNVTMILGVDDISMGGVHRVRAERKKQQKPEIVAGGYAACDDRSNPFLKEGTEVLADSSMQGYTRKALQVAIDLMDGKPAPERVEVEMPLSRSVIASGPLPARPVMRP